MIKRRKYNTTLFCIDEPEDHMNTRLQGALLKVLYDLVTDGSQLWIATHSNGMIRCARDLAADHPGTVVFIDFGGMDFDEAQTIITASPTRLIWQHVLDVALDDMTNLIAPKKIVVCEGSPVIAKAGNIAGMDSIKHGLKLFF